MRKASRLEGVGLSLLRRVVSQAPNDAIDLGLGEPGLAPPSALCPSIDELGNDTHGYTPNAGIHELREMVALYLGAAGGANAVCMTVGSEEALFTTLLAFVDPGDEVLVPDPGYPAYPNVARLAGGVPVVYRLPAETGFDFSLDEIERQLSPRTRAIIVTTPSNPTGGIIPREQLQQLAELARAKDVLLISDEVYREIYFDERPASLLDVCPEGIVVGGLSKSAGLTGWRLGWAAGSQERIEAITVVHQYATTCAPTPSQRLALALLRDLDPSVFEARRRIYRARRDLMSTLVKSEMRVPAVLPGGAYYMLAEAAPRGDSLAVALDLLERTEVLTIPGVAFGEEASRYLRLTFSAEENTIREGVTRLGAALSLTSGVPSPARLRPPLLP
jgi:aminotransferase